jgi:ribonuclease HII
VLAKVYRDSLLIELDRQYPGYGLASHKGYCSAEHMAALARLGPTPLHRKSFGPVAQQSFGFSTEANVEDVFDEATTAF